MRNEIPVLKINNKVNSKVEYYLPIGGSLFYVGCSPLLLKLYLDNHIGKLKDAISGQSHSGMLRYSYEAIRKDCAGHLPKPFIYRYVP